MYTTSLGESTMLDTESPWRSQQWISLSMIARSPWKVTTCLIARLLPRFMCRTVQNLFIKQTLSPPFEHGQWFAIFQFLQSFSTLTLSSSIPLKWLCAQGNRNAHFGVLSGPPSLVPVIRTITTYGVGVIALWPSDWWWSEAKGINLHHNTIGLLISSRYLQNT